MDNLARSAMLAKQKGMSYGRYQALYGKPVVKQEEKPLPEKWQVCPWCGKKFKKRSQTKQIYCEPYCQSEAAKQRARDRKEAKKNERT